MGRAALQGAHHPARRGIVDEGTIVATPNDIQVVTRSLSALLSSHPAVDAVKTTWHHTLTFKSGILTKLRQLDKHLGTERVSFSGMASSGCHVNARYTLTQCKKT